MISDIFAPDHIVAVELAGRLTKADIDTVHAQIDAALARHQRIGVVVDLTHFEDAQLDAVLADARMEAEFLTRLSRFARIGVVADRQWIGSTIRLMVKLVPGVETRIFRSGEEEEAVAWTARFDPDAQEKTTESAGPAGSTGSGFRRLNSDRRNLVVVRVDGRLSEDAIEDIADELRAVFKSERKVDLIVEVADWQGFELKALFDDDLWKMKAGAWKHLRRYAVVGAPGWMTMVASAAARVMPFELRAFGAGEMEAAREWVDA